MFKSLYCVGGAAIKIARSISTMLDAETTFRSSSFAPFNFALFLGVHVLATPSSRLSGRGAPFPRAEPVATMFAAETVANYTFIASFSRADTLCTMFLTKSFSCSVAAAA